MLSAAKMNAPEPPVGSRTVMVVMGCQKAMSRSGPSQFWMASCANWRMSRLRVIKSLISVMADDTSLWVLAAGGASAGALRGGVGMDLDGPLPPLDAERRPERGAGGAASPRPMVKGPQPGVMASPMSLHHT